MCIVGPDLRHVQNDTLVLDWPLYMCVNVYESRILFREAAAVGPTCSCLIRTFVKCF